MKPLRPVLDRAEPPRLEPVADGLWRVERRLRLPFGMILPTNMTVVRLAGDDLLLHSPLPADETTRKELASLGKVRAVVAPNPFHHLYVRDALNAWPEATLFTTPGLAERVPELPKGVVLDEEAPGLWAGTLSQALFGPVGPFTEVVFLHRPSGTLILTDLAFHMVHIRGAWQRLAWRAFGVPPKFGPSRTDRFTLLSDRELAARFLERVLEWEFDRILVAHGEPVEAAGHVVFERAFAGYRRRGGG